MGKKHYAVQLAEVMKDKSLTDQVRIINHEGTYYITNGHALAALSEFNYQSLFLIKFNTGKGPKAPVMVEEGKTVTAYRTDTEFYETTINIQSLIDPTTAKSGPDMTITPFRVAVYDKENAVVYKLGPDKIGLYNEKYDFLIKLSEHRAQSDVLGPITIYDQYVGVRAVVMPIRDQELQDKLDMLKVS